MNRLIMALIIWLMMPLTIVVSSRDQAAAASRADARQPRLANDSAIHRQVEVTTILAVLERTIADPMLRTRAAAKLATLSDRQLRLMASLSERVAVDGDGPASRIALFLIAALLVLS